MNFKGRVLASDMKLLRRVTDCVSRMNIFIENMSDKRKMMN